MEEEERDSKREESFFVNNIKTHYYKTTQRETHVTLHNGADKFHETHVSTLPRDVFRRYRFNRLTEYFCLVVFFSYISIDLVFLQGRWKLLVFWWSGRGRSRHAGFHFGFGLKHEAIFSISLVTLWIQNVSEGNSCLENRKRNYSRYMTAFRFIRMLFAFSFLPKKVKRFETYRLKCNNNSLNSKMLKYLWFSNRFSVLQIHKPNTKTRYLGHFNI